MKEKSLKLPQRVAYIIKIEDEAKEENTRVEEVVAPNAIVSFVSFPPPSF